jgi:4-carboxymuconolactone decarboxylase
MKSDKKRRALGTKKIQEVVGHTVEMVEGHPGDIAPDLVTYVLGVIFGDTSQSKVLDARTRQIVTVSVLATLGTAPAQLRTHLGGALRSGVSRKELVEIMTQLVPYAGIASAINGVTACRDVFAAEDVEKADKKEKKKAGKTRH